MVIQLELYSVKNEHGILNQSVMLYRHFHCNYGVNVVWFDRFHGTLRRKNRVYGEKNFGGAGRPRSEDKMDDEPQYCEY